MQLASLLQEACNSALKEAFPEQYSAIPTEWVEVTESTTEAFGHFQFNGAMKLAKMLKLKPNEIADKLLEKLRANTRLNEVVDSIEIKGPGFINFTLKASYISDVLNKHLRDERFGIPLEDKQKIIVDFSSPNTAKEMHVGHLRSTIIGDCLRRFFSFLGHDLLALNHVGDWGTQFGMLITYFQQLFPGNQTLPEDITLANLAAWYKESKKKFDEDPLFKKQSQQAVVALQNHDARSLNTWKKICEISRKAYEHIYQLLEVELLERGESFYNDKLSEVIQDLENKNLISLSDGAKCVFLEGFTNREGEPLPLILQKSDGAYNYATTDLAALKHRLEEENAKVILYVVDAGQSLHFQMIFATARKAQYYEPANTRVEHVPFGLVLRPDGKKFKTREGDTEKLIDLIQNAIDKSKEILIKRAEESQDNLGSAELENRAHILGINAIKYADLSCNRMSDYVFSYDKMLKFEGNTAAFIMYAYVRILSIQRKAKVTIDELIKTNEKIQLNLPVEISLGLLLCQFQTVLEAMKKDLMPSRLTDYLYRLAEKFHLFFHHCRVEGVPEQNARLLLIEAVARVLRLGMQILGLKPLEKM